MHYSKYRAVGKSLLKATSCMSLLYIFIGGGLGSMCRYIVGHYCTDQSGFPLGTFVANIIACTILGILLGYQQANNINTSMKLLLMTGFCGGFSTFSTFSSESLSLIQQGQLGLALAYIGLSIILGLIAIYLGYKMYIA